MSDTLEHRCALQSPCGTTYDYMSNQEKIYIYITDLCSCTGEERGGKHVVKFGCSVQCDLGTERISMEFIWRWDSRVRGEDCLK